MTLRDFQQRQAEKEPHADTGISARSRLGFESNVVQLHQVLAVKLDDRGRDGDLPMRPWWVP